MSAWRRIMGTRATVVFAVVFMGMTAVILVLYAGNTFKGQIIAQEEESLTSLLATRTSEQFREFSSKLTEIGLVIQNDAGFRDTLRGGDRESLATLLQDRFYQYPLTVEGLELDEMAISDSAFAVVAQARADQEAPRLRACIEGETPHFMSDEMTRRKIHTGWCRDAGRLWLHVTLPVGAFNVAGYLHLFADVRQRLGILEELVGYPLRAVLDDEALYESDLWPAPEHAREFVHATTMIEIDPRSRLIVAAARDLRKLHANMRSNQAVVLGSALVATVLCGLLSLVVIGASVLAPLRRLTAQLARMREDRGRLGETMEERGNADVRSLIAGFNSMTTEMRRLYENLSDSNEELEKEVRIRRRIEQEIKRARDMALASARIKSEFLANVSHEIRTPMCGILGMLDLLADTPMSPDQFDYVDMARRSGDTLLNIINDILDLSKLEAGRLVLEDLELDLSQQIKTVLELFSDQARAKNVELKCELEENLPAKVSGDPTRLQQVLINLVGNAIKFTDHGQVVFRVKLERESDEHIVLRFEVEDTGIGIPADKRGKIFESFMQADGSMTRKYGGTGLGLAIVKQIATLMGGQVGVESEPGKGSVFWVTVRFGRSHLAPLCFVYERAAGDLRFLIVDQDSRDHGGLEALLDAWAIPYDQVNSASDALARLASSSDQNRPYSAVFLSTRFENFLDIAESLSTHHAAPPLGIVALRRVGEHEFAPEWARRGITTYVNKPLSQDQLYECVSRLLGSRAAQAMAPQATVREPIGEGLRILVAEDNLVNQKVAVGLLKRGGYHVDVAENGRDAVVLWQKEAHDLILMDCQMPEMDGYAASREIRRLELQAGTGKRVPIIALTAHSLAVTWDQCRQAGMDDFLSKPVKPTALRSMLRRWLAHRSAPAPEEQQPAAVADTTADIS